MLRLPFQSAFPWIGGALAGAALGAVPVYLQGRADGGEAERGRQARAALDQLQYQRQVERGELSSLLNRIEDDLARRRAFEAEAAEALTAAAQSTQQALQRLGATYDPSHACPASDHDVRLFNAAFARSGDGPGAVSETGRTARSDPQ
jgi:hypothetical protein